MKQITACILLSILFFSCNQDTEETENKIDPKTLGVKIPEESDLSKFSNSVFLYTAEQSFEKNKNCIYSPTIIYCWDEIKKEFKDSVIVDTSLKLLNKIHQSTRHIRVLRQEDYTVEKKISGNKISIKASFSKNLSFPEPMYRYDEKRKFHSELVEVFGFLGYDHYITEYCSINFFTDNDYSISIRPSDNAHEIIIYYPGNEKHQNFAEAFDSLISKKENFGNSDNTPYWKKRFYPDDEVYIPVIAFNLATKIEELIGNEFYPGSKMFYITDAKQRNAFLLNESGAIVESEGEMDAVEAAEEELPEELPKPKLFYFNKPFYIFLKRRNAKNPYFAVYIQNTEFMIK